MTLLLVQLPKTQTQDLDIFYQLSALLSNALNSNVLEHGIAVRSDNKIPEAHMEEWMTIRTKLNAAGGIYRSRATSNRLKDVCDLWRRVGQSLLKRVDANYYIEMDARKITIDRRAGKRIQVNAYTYNLVAKQKIILAL